jgi:hypothetical protein
MSTFIHQPRVYALVSSINKQGKEQVYDLSEDLVSGTLTLRTEGVHTFQFQLQNAQRKYDGIIRPMDRIIVSMKRVGNPLRVFSGYMNEGPVFSVWPRVLSLSASCTLKRLQYWFWDSGAQDSASLIQQMGAQTTGTQNLATDSGATGQNAGQPTGDGGMRDLTMKILEQVVKWPTDKVHIGAIPNDWFTFATDIGDEIIKASDYSNLIGSMGSGLSGNGSLPGGNLSHGKIGPGTYGGINLNADQATIASEIYNVAVDKGLSGEAAAEGIAVGIVESGLRNLDHGDGDSVGVFQQRPSQGWGSQAQCMDVAYAAGAFFDHLVKVPGYQTADFGVVCQEVQRSAYPDKYVTQQANAEAIVKALVAAGKSVPNALVGSGQGGTIGSATAVGKPQGATGRNMAAQAYNLIKGHPAGHIRYQLGGDDPYNSPDPLVLDCSSFVDVAYFRTVGRALLTPRSTVATERPHSTIITADQAREIKGALLFNGTEHVEVSLGNGYSAGAHTDGIPLDKQVSIVKADGFTDGGLLNGLNYSDAATTQDAAQVIQSKLGYSANVTDPNEFAPDGSTVDAAQGADGAGATALDVFNSLINIYTWGYVPDLAGQILVGPRALMNDQPLLPFIANLMSASMRSWCSAPNGDFMAWFPDYFDLWGIAAKMDVRSIELMDFTVTWSDLQTITHQYVIGVPAGITDSIDSSGNTTANGSNDGYAWQLTSSGIATMDFPQIFRAIFGQDASQDFLDEFLGRFGARPNTVTVPTVKQGMPEFFLALFLFMRKWADQFSASIPLTFMPELWPGMILRLPEFNFQAYVLGVQHTFQMGENGSFRTSVDVCAPSRITQKQNDVFGLLPLGGKRYDVKRLDANLGSTNLGNGIDVKAGTLTGARTPS